MECLARAGREAIVLPLGLPDANLEHGTREECLREAGLDLQGSVSTYFDSAWSPPMGIVEELSARGLEVTLYYYEPGMAYVGKYEDGYDDYYDLGGLDSSTVTAAIGNELDDFFGISESMAEYEAENAEEELTEWLKDGVEKRKLEVLE